MYQIMTTPPPQFANWGTSPYTGEALARCKPSAKNLPVEFHGEVLNFT